MKTHRLTIIIGLTQALAWATSYYITALITSSVAAEFHAAPTVLYGGFSWALLITGLCSPRVGRRIERTGGRGVLAAGALLMGAGLLLMSVCHSVAGWYFAWTVEGVGMALGLYDAAFATLGRLLGTAARPSIVGVTLMAGFASTIGWLVGVPLLDAVGWRALAVIYAGVHMLWNAPLILALVPRAGPAPSANTTDAAAATVRSDDVLPPELRLTFILLAVYFSIRAGINAIITVHVLTLLHGLGLTAAAAVTTAALIGPSQVSARLIDWTIGRRQSPILTGRLGAALLPLGLVGLFAGLPASVFAIGYGLSNGILTISRGLLPLQLFGPAGYATLLGRLALPQMLMQAAAPTLVAPLVAAWPARSVLMLMLGLSAVAFVTLLCVRGRDRIGGGR